MLWTIVGIIAVIIGAALLVNMVSFLLNDRRLKKMREEYLAEHKEENNE